MRTARALEVLQDNLPAPTQGCPDVVMGAHSFMG